MMFRHRLSFLFVLLAGCAASAPERPPARPQTVQIDVIDSRNVPPERVRAWLQPAVEKMRRCLSGKTGVIAVRMTGRDRELAISAMPGVTLDDETRACANAVVSTVELGETGSNVGGPGVPPTAFTSLVTISW